MKRKQVIIVSLLIVAVILSTVAIVMNTAVFDNLQINLKEKSVTPAKPNIQLVIEQPSQNSNGEDNGV